jgi:hypothetical protein
MNLLTDQRVTTLGWTSIGLLFAASCCLFLTASRVLDATDEAKRGRIGEHWTEKLIGRDYVLFLCGVSCFVAGVFCLILAQFDR